MAGKSTIELGRLKMTFDCIDGSGERHTRTRAVTASTRRLRTSVPISDGACVDDEVQGREGEDEEEDKEWHEDQINNLMDDDGSLRSVRRRGGKGKQGQTSSRVTLRRGADGRFQSIGDGTSRTRKIRVVRASNDNTWRVQGQMSGGPKDGSVIPNYAGHIATQIWMGEKKDRDVLKCQSRTQWCLNLHEMHKAMADDVRRQVDSTGLSGLVNIIHHHIDWALISAFVERWQPDTNTFHFPFGEMTIMLHDV